MNPLSAVGAGVNLLTGVLGGIFAKRAHNNYADVISQQEMTMPSAITEAEGIRKGMAYSDMPGFENALNSVGEQTANTMTQAKEVVSTPSQLLDALVRSSTAGMGVKRDIYDRNAAYQVNNENALASFLSRVKAPAEAAINQFDIDRNLSAAKERMSGTEELLKGITGGLGSAFSAFGQGEQLGNQTNYTNALIDYFKKK